jgi:urease accessory protein
MILRRCPWLAILLLAVAPPVLAHVDGGAAAGFVSGASHPVSGLDHVLAMLAVGLWGVQLGMPALWLLPIAFPMMMAVGGLLGLGGLGLPGIEIGIALSAVVLGGLILGEVQLPLAAAMLIVGGFAVLHGHAHGTEMTAGQNGLLYSLGFVIVTGLLHTAGIGIGLLHRWHAGRLALRGAGVLVMIGGLLFLGAALS